VELWFGDLPDFIKASNSSLLADEMTRTFERIYRRAPGESEHTSWQESLRAVANVADESATDDIGVLVEYHLPLSERRIDVMLFGGAPDGAANSLLIELKRWESVDLEDEYALNVLTGDTEHVHPSQQALDYAEYLRDVHSEYADRPFGVRPCSYCHDMTRLAGAPLVDPRFVSLLAKSPVFLAGDEPALAELLNKEIVHGRGVELMHHVRAGHFKPSRKVVDSLDAVLHQDDEWHLLDEQRVAFNAIWAEVQRLRHEHNRRSAVLVRGGPGTGKSVIAIQLLAQALREGLAAAHATGGKAFTTVMRGKFTGAKSVFLWNMNMRNAPQLGLDLLLVDEAHRIRETSDTRYTSKAQQKRRTQIDELLDGAKVTVFLLDEHQYMRPDEIGSSRLVREATEKRGIPLRQYDLATQFRCGGSREYVEWLDEVLGLASPGSSSWYGSYGFDLVNDTEELEDFVEVGVASGESSRLLAGFCWKWSAPLAGGVLEDDVVIGSWKRPWNRKRDAKKTYKPENDPYTLWATTAEGDDQVGCIYSAQGFEFDRVGVIWGPDLVWRDGQWVGQKQASKDGGLRGATPEQVTRLLKHAYRVLLSRGIKATRVLCLDPETRQYLATQLALVRERASVFA
jgi:uncharacterized protein